MKNSRCILICIFGVTTLIHNGSFASPTKSSSHREKNEPGAKPSAEKSVNSKYNKLLAKALVNLSFIPNDLDGNYNDMMTDAVGSQRALDTKLDEVQHLKDIVSESLEFMHEARSQVGRLMGGWRTLSRVLSIFLQTFFEKLFSTLTISKGFLPTPVVWLVRLMVKLLRDINENICDVTSYCYLFTILRRIAGIL